jgi:hypothetical protein
LHRHSVAALAGGFIASATRFAVAAPEKQEMNPAEVEAWLESRALKASTDAGETPEVPPPPPRDYGFVVETSVGALTHLGDMKHVSPTSPWFRAMFGWEPLRWLMVAASADVAFGSTRYANPPPGPRGFVLFGFSAGPRFTLEPTDWLGLFLQGEIGIAEVSEDVLGTYGFDDADQLGPYFGGMLGFEWFQVNPHYAIVGSGGVRSYAQILDRPRSSDPPLAWMASLGLGYTF